VDAGVDVLLVEAGGPDDNPNIHDPSKGGLLFGTEVDWGYSTVPQGALDGRRLPVTRGRVLGGSSCLNGMNYGRGAPSDYDSWAAAGNTGWGYREVLPAFMRSEDFDAGPNDYHGVGGPLRVMSLYEPHPLLAAGVEAAVEQGMPRNPDYNSPELDGASFMQLNIKNGERHSAARAFVHPVREAPNLRVWTGYLGRRLLFDADRCVGIEVIGPGGIETIRAEREVVLSAGAIDSPKLLLLSGIGPADELRALGIEVLIDLPVGRNLHDHVNIRIVCAARRPVPPALPGLQQIHGLFLWRSTGNGQPAPDVGTSLAHLPMHPEGQTGPSDGLTFNNVIARPESRGTLRLASPDPTAPALIDPGYLTAGSEIDVMLAAIERAREVAAAPALRDWLDRELYPGPETRSRSELEQYIRSTASTSFHPVGSCRMGIDEQAVVDPALRVRGIEGLRIADASIMPAITTFNVNGPTMMIGERAADFVLASD
jgi:choline dehydrogenase